MAKWLAKYSLISCSYSSSSCTALFKLVIILCQVYFISKIIPISLYSLHLQHNFVIVQDINNTGLNYLLLVYTSDILHIHPVKIVFVLW